MSLKHDYVNEMLVAYWDNEIQQKKKQIEENNKKIEENKKRIKEIEKQIEENKKIIKKNNKKLLTFRLLGCIIRM